MGFRNQMLRLTRPVAVPPSPSFSCAGAKTARIGVGRWLAAAVLGCVAHAACAGRNVTPISPDELPQLEARLARAPEDATTVLRYAAALFTAAQCDSARAVARNGMTLRPHDALGPLVLGQCLEHAEQLDEAIAVYGGYLAAYPDARGSDGVRARELIALRTRARFIAREAVAHERELAQQVSDSWTIAVLPVEIAGDTAFAPLSRGLAHMLTSDLALLRRFRLVERLQVGALLDELQLVQTGRVDPTTAARLGNLLRAGRMVQGLAVIPSRDQEVRLEAGVVDDAGQLMGSGAVTGRFRDLLQLEKQLVLGIADRLGYTLSESERALLLENGTRNLAAFLAYSRGLLAEDLGDYGAAAGHYAAAIRADPGFTEARSRYRAASVAGEIAGAAPSEVMRTAQLEAPPLAGAELTEAVAVAAAAVEQELAATQGESATAPHTQVTGTTSADPSGTQTTHAPPETAAWIISIVFRLP